MLHVCLHANLVMYLHQPLLLVLMCQERVAGVTGLVIGGLIGITLGHWERTWVRGSIERRLPCEHHRQRQSAFSRLCRPLHPVRLPTPGARAAPKLPQPREVLRSLQTICGESTLWLAR